ncbi:hypothetical protein LTR36_010324 [Oleoguttula mirabilis]|uniref:Uncharacterized protein n=1 Tax=Oleoguttula mirabilis TaxID=1507867 RepID=A0AAV9J531_9PEZI|nr:hypothetical protein LTR36_010324 [Oleoguttula mirabilis]
MNWVDSVSTSATVPKKSALESPNKAKLARVMVDNIFDEAVGGGTATFAVRTVWYYTSGGGRCIVALRTL